MKPFVVTATVLGFGLARAAGAATTAEPAALLKQPAPIVQNENVCTVIIDNEWHCVEVCVTPSGDKVYKLCDDSKL